TNIASIRILPSGVKQYVSYCSSSQGGNQNALHPRSPATPQACNAQDSETWHVNSKGYKEPRNANKASWSDFDSPTKPLSAFCASTLWRRIASSIVFDRPSCMKRSRCDSPHKGAVRKSSPVASNCTTPSPVPMLCSSRSENK